MPEPALRAFFDAEMARLERREPRFAFAAEEYARRRDRLRRGMAEAGIDLLLVSSPDAMCWLHGYQSRWYMTHSPTAWPPVQCTAVHVDHDRLIQFDMADHEHLIRLSSVVEDRRLWDVVELDTMLGFLARELAGEGWLRGTVGVEKWSSVPNRAVGEAVETMIAGRGCRVVDASLVVRAARRVKSPAEIAKIEEAARICDIGLLALRDALRPGVTELQVWAAMMSAMAAAGGEPAAIHERVSLGGTAMGHSIASRRTLRAGDMVGADPCGVVDRYHANSARAYFLGEPPPEAVRLSRIQGGAFDVLCDVAKAGTPVRDVNRALRAYYEDAGVWDLRGWVGGYELGISFPPDWVGEWLFTVEEDDPDGVIEAGMVTNFESVFLMSMIDTIVYEDGGARRLSAVPLEVQVAG